MKQQLLCYILLISLLFFIPISSMHEIVKRGFTAATLAYYSEYKKKKFEYTEAVGPEVAQTVAQNSNTVQVAAPIVGAVMSLLGIPALPILVGVGAALTIDRCVKGSSTPASTASNTNSNTVNSNTTKNVPLCELEKSHAPKEHATSNLPTLDSTHSIQINCNDLDKSNSNNFHGSGTATHQEIDTANGYVSGINFFAWVGTKIYETFVYDKANEVKSSFYDPERGDYHAYAIDGTEFRSGSEAVVKKRAKQHSKKVREAQKQKAQQEEKQTAQDLIKKREKKKLSKEQIAKQQAKEACKGGGSNGPKKPENEKEQKERKTNPESFKQDFKNDPQVKENYKPCSDGKLRLRENAKNPLRDTKGKPIDEVYADHDHCDIEAYRNGKHVGSIDPITKQIYKAPVLTRIIKPGIQAVVGAMGISEEKAKAEAVQLKSVKVEEKKEEHKYIKREDGHTSIVTTEEKVNDKTEMTSNTLKPWSIVYNLGDTKAKDTKVDTKIESKLEKKVEASKVETSKVELKNETSKSQDTKNSCSNNSSTGASRSNSISNKVDSLKSASANLNTKARQETPKSRSTTKSSRSNNSSSSRSNNSTRYYGGMQQSSSTDNKADNSPAYVIFKHKF